jgi:hypothetical protein
MAIQQETRAASDHDANVGAALGFAAIFGAVRLSD